MKYYDSWYKNNYISIENLEIEDREKISITLWGKEDYGYDVPITKEYYVLYEDVIVATITAEDYTATDFFSDEYLKRLREPNNYECAVL